MSVKPFYLTLESSGNNQWWIIRSIFCMKIKFFLADCCLVFDDKIKFGTYILHEFCSSFDAAKAQYHENNSSLISL